MKFSDLYPAKFLDISAKLFFPCTNWIGHFERIASPQTVILYKRQGDDEADDKKTSPG